MSEPAAKQAVSLEDVFSEASERLRKQRETGEVTMPVYVREGDHFRVLVSRGEQEKVGATPMPSWPRKQ